MTQAPEDAILASWAANAAPWIALLQGSGIASRQTTNPAIINAISRYQPDSLLDVGCGEGWLCRALAAEESAPATVITGVDAIPALVENAQAQHSDGTYLCSDYTQLPNALRGQTFAVIVCNFSLFGEDSVAQLLATLKHHLRADGTLLIQTLHPLMACNGDYRSGWRTGSWAGCSDTFQSAPPWYFRTLSDWLALLQQQGLHVHMEEPLDPQTHTPLSVIFHARRP